MRFETLTLECYGRYEETRLALPPPGLCIVFGANEAGKSSALEAIGDFLYGVPERSPRGQIFGAERLRIGATIRLADGTPLTLKRRKGRKATLIDADGGPVDDAVLAAALGATTRDRFSSLFGLSHESLRKGGEALMKADGEIGQIILAAGGGLGALIPLVDALRDDAARLYGDRRSKNRQFYIALEAFEAAEAARKERLVTREQHEKALQSLNGARDRLDDRRARLKAISEEKHRLDRQARVAPALARLDAAKGELAAYEALGPLGDEFAARCAEAFAAAKTAHAALVGAEQRLAALQSRIDAQNPPAEIIAAADAIADAAVRATLVGQQRLDRAKREMELETTRAALAPLRERLGVADDAGLEAAAPSREALAALRALLTQGEGRRAKFEGLKAQSLRESEAQAAILARQQARRAAGRDRPLGFEAAAFAGLPGEEAVLARRRKTLAEAQERQERDLAALGYGAFEELAAQAFPGDDDLAAESARRLAVESRRSDLRKSIDDMRAKSARAGADLALLEGARIPSAAALDEARAARDRLLGEVGARYGGASAGAEIAQSARAGEVSRLARLVGEADTLADRRSSEAQRVAALELAARERAGAEAALAASTAALKTLDAEAIEATEAWRAAWPAAARFAELGRLRQAIAARADFLRAREARLLEAETLEAEESAHASWLGALRHAEARLGLDGSGTLTARAAAAIAAAREHGADYADFRADQQAQDDAARKIEAIEREHRALLEADERWTQLWKPALAALGAPPGATYEDVAELAALWADAPGRFESLRNTRGRLTGMDRDAADLAERVAALGAAMSFPLPQDPVAAARLLEERRDAANKTAAMRESLESERLELASERDDAARRLDLAGAALARLRDMGRCADDAELAALGGRCAERVALQAKIRALEEQIASIGDGLSLDDLRAEAAGRSVEEIRAAAQELDEDRAAMEHGVEEARAALQDRERETRALEAGSGVNAAVAARERAAAQMHETLERYVETALAEDLLREAMKRLREQRRDPLFARAGELFAAATRGAFAGIATEINAEGEPAVVGRRDDGRPVEIIHMSDGARDQLYLAFRIASVERYAARAEPIPFIADDLLVHFDDERSAATLDILAELGRTTQVLLFTHHRSVRDAAQRLVAAGTAAAIDLGG